MTGRGARYFLICLLLAAITSTSVGAQGSVAPAAGVFLVATRKIDGTSFERTVILLTQADARGAMGLAINRSSKRPIAEFFPELDAPADVPLLLGGPVHPTALFVLTRRPPGDQGREVLRDLYLLAGDPAYDHLKRELKGTRHDGFRTYAGYAGWAPGQLEAEIQRGDWLTVKFDARIVFDKDVESMWEILHRAATATWI